MRILVCGGRDYNDWKVIETALEHFKPTELVHGGCRGVDTIAGNWAKRKGIPVQEFKADWDKFGRAAGPIRNQQMLDEAKPELLLMFPGGVGTRGMANLAREAGVKVTEISEARYGR